MAASSGYNASDVPVPQDSSSLFVAFSLLTKLNENERKTNENEIETKSTTKI